MSRSYCGWETGICQSGDCFSDLCNFWEVVKNLENGFKIFKFSYFIKLSARTQLEKDTVEDFFSVDICDKRAKLNVREIFSWDSGCRFLYLFTFFCRK